MLFTCELVTYNGVYKTIETDKLNVPAIDGRRTVLSNHMPVMIPLEVGIIETSKNGVLSHYAVTDGMLMFENNYATILADEIIDVKEINVEKAKKNMEKEQNKQNESKDEAEILRAKIAIQRQLNLINAANKYNN